MVVSPSNQSTQGYLIDGKQIPQGTITPLMLAATPTIANGDTYYSNGSTFVRLPIGSNGSLPIVSGGIPAFLNPGTNGQLLEVVNGTPAWATVTTPVPTTLSMHIQNDTANSVKTISQQAGWGQFDITAGTHLGSDAITFPVVFPTGIYSVVTNIIGTTLGTVTDITSFTTSAATTGLTMAFHADSITTSGFNVSILYSGNVGATTHVGYGWIAIGN